jgi:hypothetical protein
MGFRLCCAAAASLARTIAPAPSEMPEAFPGQYMAIGMHVDMGSSSSIITNETQMHMKYNGI